MTRTPHRYAVYLVPTGPWARLGVRWLGRDALTGETVPRRIVPLSLALPAQESQRPADQALDARIDRQIDEWTRAPRHYGLHATLKPPFRLRETETPQALDAALRQLARSHTPFEIPLQLTALRGFLAWCVAKESDSYADVHTSPRIEPIAAPLHRLADDCVATLDRFRAPASESEIGRRRASGLSAEQDAHLLRWGYPYVFETFIFHITLSGRLGDDAMTAAREALARLAGPNDREALDAAAAMPVSEIGLFVQMTPEAPFVVARRYGFDGSVRDDVGAAAIGASGALGA